MGELAQTDYLHIQVDEHLKRRIRAAAGAEDLSMAEWVRQALDEAADVEVPDPGEESDSPVI